MAKIPFNKPYLTGNETVYIEQAVRTGHISGNGNFTKKCHAFLENKFGFKKCLLTTSCTDALEMSALLIDVQQGDEVIVPAYTFVSTALAFVRQGARIIFCDSKNNHPGIDEDKIEELITNKTKAIVVVHYAGVACDMDKIMDIAERNNLYVVEDAAQAIDSTYKGRPLGGIGHLGCFSFHETKNIQSGEGGMLTINRDEFIARAEIIWEKGTNRTQFFRGEIDKYGWVDIGSSFLPSEITAAFLYAQMENLDEIQNKRIELWNTYYSALRPLADIGCFKIPAIPEYAINNAHMFFIICKNLDNRTHLIQHLKNSNISAVFHYLSLHKSPYYKDKHKPVELKCSDQYTSCLLRLPLYFELGLTDIKRVIDQIELFFKT